MKNVHFDYGSKMLSAYNSIINVTNNHMVYIPKFKYKKIFIFHFFLPSLVMKSILLQL